MYRPAAVDGTGAPVERVVGHEADVGRHVEELPVVGEHGVDSQVVVVAEHALAQHRGLDPVLEAPEAIERAGEEDRASTVDLALHVVARRRREEEEIVPVLEDRESVVRPARQVRVREIDVGVGQVAVQVQHGENVVIAEHVAEGDHARAGEPDVRGKEGPARDVVAREPRLVRQAEERRAVGERLAIDLLHVVRQRRIDHGAVEPAALDAGTLPRRLSASAYPDAAAAPLPYAYAEPVPFWSSEIPAAASTRVPRGSSGRVPKSDARYSLEERELAHVAHRVDVPAAPRHRGEEEPLSVRRKRERRSLGHEPGDAREEVREPPRVPGRQIHAVDVRDPRAVGDEEERLPVLHPLRREVRSGLPRKHRDALRLQVEERELELAEDEPREIRPSPWSVAKASFVPSGDQAGWRTV